MSTPTPAATPAAPPAADAPTGEQTNMILPPPAIRAIVDKTAAFVAKSPNAALFEDKIRAREKSDSRFAFLNAADAYHPYYQQRLDAFHAGEVPEAKQDQNGAAGEGAEGAQGAEESDGRPKEPPQLEFLVESPPPMNAVDLDILRLTALFTARSGRRFTSELASRENRNYQFDFLRPSHSLFGYFNRLTEQYTKILIPSKEAQACLERRSGGPPTEEDRTSNGRREVLKDAKERAEWERWESSRRKEFEDAQEADRIAFAEIDWQDFVVVSTVEFTEGDEAGLVELPPPMSISEVENMTLAQKKMAAMIMEGREEEVAENERERERGEEAEMDMDDDEDEAPAADQQAKLEQERQRVVQAAATDSSAPMKIRKDYVPKAKRPAQAAQAYTTFGDQQVPVEEFAEHVRIELLDPRWKEEKRQSEANRSAANLLPGGTDVASSMRALAAHRPDIFSAGGDEEAKKRQAEALAKSKTREMGVWDGHSATKDAITNRYQTGANFDEQIEALHRAKGLLGPEDGQEPKIGPSAPAPAPVPAAPEPTSFTSCATISAAPQPHQQSAPSFAPQQYQQPGYGQPPSSYPPPSNYPPAFSAPLPHAGLPARPSVPNPGEPLPGPPAATLAPTYGRPAPDALEDERSAKRQRVEKREDGSFWPEADWIAAHPDDITLTISMPDYPSKPAWGCDGTDFNLDVPLALLVATLRDRIAAKRGLPISKQKLTYNGRVLVNSATLAGLNLQDGDKLHVSVKEKK